MPNNPFPPESLMLTEYKEGTVLKSELSTTKGTRIKLLEPHHLLHRDRKTNQRKHIGNLQTRFKVLALGGSGLKDDWSKHLGVESTGKELFESGNFSETFWHGNRFVPVPEDTYIETDTKKNLNDIINTLKALDAIELTTRSALAAIRIGQSQLRTYLLKRFRHCALTLISDEPLLRASHIKPWKSSSVEERKDPFNVLLLSGLWDAAFDAGLVSFELDGAVRYSLRLTKQAKDQLHNSQIGSFEFDQRHRQYLLHHHQHVFKQ